MWSHVNSDLQPRYVSSENDPKPTKDVPNGAILFEMGTGIYYMFDEENSVWHPLG